MPVILPDAQTALGWSQTEYRRAVQQELGRFHVLTVTSSLPSSGYPDALRTVICADLGSRFQPDRLDGMYLYVANGDQAGQSRCVLSGTFDGPAGVLLVDAPFAAQLALGTEVELSPYLPGNSYLEVVGANQIVDEALERTTVEARLPFTGDGTHTVSLVDWPFLQREEQVKALRDHRLSWRTDVPTRVSYYRWQLHHEGATVTLETERRYSPSEQLELVVLVPGSRLLGSGGAWGYFERPGLCSAPVGTNAAAPVHWVREIGCVQAFKHLLEVTEEDLSLTDALRQRRTARYQARMQQYAVSAATMKQNQFPRPDPKPPRLPTLSGHHRHHWTHWHG